MQKFPTWGERLLRAICPEKDVDHIIGDLIELNEHNISKFGQRKAGWILFVSVIRFLRPGIVMRNKFSLNIMQGAMLGHYLKITSRHLLKSKLNFSLKLLGLCCGFTSSLIIILYVTYQLSFDKFHEDYANIYRVNSQWKENGELVTYALVPRGVGPMLIDEFPEVGKYARMVAAGRCQITYKDKSFHAEGISGADSTIFDVLSFNFIKGDYRALHRPGSIVLTESLAKKIFGDVNPLEESITFTDRAGVMLQVTGIVEDLPSNTHLNITAIASLGSLADNSFLSTDPWEISIDGATVLYVKLSNESNTKELVSRATPEVRKRITKNESGLEKEFSIALQPLEDIYLDRWVYAEFSRKGNAVYVYVFIVLGAFLLIISAANYINLAIAEFYKRLKEIGVRKIMGALKRQIAFQVLFETCLLAFLSLIISIITLYIIFPEVQSMLDPNLRFEMLMSRNVITIVACTLTLIVILSTMYPATHLAIKSPVQNMKSISKSRGNSGISRILFICQFSISIIAVTATLIVGRQLSFIQERNPGYDRENLIVAYMPDQYPGEKVQVIKDEFSKISGVEGVSFSTFRIAGAGYYRDWYRVETDEGMKQMMLNEVFFDHEFFDVTGIPLVEGRSFDPKRSTDSHEAFIVNETAVRAFGWKDPIGKRISYGYEETDGEKWEGIIVGVVKDFNVYSLHKQIEPLVMRLPWSDWPGSCIHIRINGPLEETLKRIEDRYAAILPGFILHYSIVDDLYNSQYTNERKVYAALQLSTWVIVIISSIGIFSLSLYLSMRHMKEFGIRKVLGATGLEITLQHTNRFVRIGLIANGLGLPIAWIIIVNWLDQFAYKTDVSVFLFCGVALTSLTMVIISAGYSSWKSGTMNPLDVIKSD